MKIVKIGAAIIKNNKVLVVKEKDWKKYGIPGGKSKPGENDMECLKREIKEELDADILSAEHVGTFEDAAMNEIGKTIQIKLYSIKLDGEPEKTSEIEDLFWLGKDDDLSLLGQIDKNHLIPALIEKGLFR